VKEENSNSGKNFENRKKLSEMTQQIFGYRLLNERKGNNNLILA
jgi:hypothetical protein